MVNYISNSRPEFRRDGRANLERGFDATRERSVQIPFTQTFFGAVLVLVVGGILLVIIQKYVPEENVVTHPTGIVKDTTDSMNALAEAQRKQAEAESRAKLLQAETERQIEQMKAEQAEKLQQLRIKNEAQKREMERAKLRQQRAAQQQEIQQAREREAYRAANGGCDIGERPQCLSMGTIGNMQDYGCVCVSN